MKRYLTLLIALGMASVASAQGQQPLNIRLDGAPQCGFNKVLQKVNVPYSTLIAAYGNDERSAGNRTAAKGTAPVYDIPVVFHIVYNAGQPTFNLPDSVIKDQVKALNDAFRKRNADTVNIRSVFKPLAGDAEIQFHLASVDPQGNPTTGITRTASSRAYFGTSTGDLDSLERIKKTAEGGKDPWPTTRYLNIWVANLSTSAGALNVLGYAIPPLNPLPPNWPAGADQELAGLIDGVVLQTHSVGTNSTLNAALQGIYTKGRCGVHEVGHYLGLQHVFGSNGGGTGSCGAIADDGISDTPEQSTMAGHTTTGCPSATLNTCGVGTPGDQPDMWENYMDYARDACQTMFTNGQIAVMRNVMGNQRNALVSTTSVGNIPFQKTFGIYPNPAADNISILYDGKISRVTIINFMGQQAMVAEGAAANARSFNISHLPAGNYMLTAEIAGERITRKFTVTK